MAGKLYCGDCLEVLEKKIQPESVDLIYLDPPFFSNRNYEVIWGDEADGRSFDDAATSRGQRHGADDRDRDGNQERARRRDH